MVLRALAGSLVLAGALAGCEGKVPAEPKASAVAVERVPTYEHVRAGLGEAIERGLALAGGRPEDGLLPLEVASLHVERARLTGEYDDYRRAEAILDGRPAESKAGASHCLARARLHYALHRLEQAGASLAACPPGTDAAEISAIRADIAMQSGRYREAEAGYRALLNQTQTPQHYIRLALLRAGMGSPAEAAALLEAAERRYHGTSGAQRSWFKLQRGLIALDRGRLDEALAMYRLAADALPGWWLVDEHIAQALHLKGDLRAAKALYAGVVERTRLPEFMDALADLEREDGRHERAEALRREARALHEKRLAEFPEAAAGHALDHFLRDPGEAGRALSLAEANFAHRPSGPAAIALAKAWIVSGKPERALRPLESRLAMGWDTAEAHWVLAVALGRLGRDAPAAQARSRALERNPLSDRMYAIPPAGKPRPGLPRRRRDR